MADTHKHDLVPVTKEKRVVGKPFAKGDDPRRKPGSRGKDFGALRQMALEIADEVEADPETGEKVIYEGHFLSKAERILRGWADNSDPRVQMMFVEVAFGKVPTETNVMGGVDLRIEYVNRRDR